MMTEQICRLQDPAAFTQKETLQERLLLLLLLVFVVVYIWDRSLKEFGPNWLKNPSFFNKHLLSII